MEKLGKIIIAGPCAVENRTQMITSAQELKEMGINNLRASWWKPRTRPGFEGMGIEAAPWAAEITKMGITIGTEVMIPDHVTDVINGIADNGGDPAKIFLWLGSRNQNQFIQRDITKRIKDEAHNNTKLLIKNQPWGDEAHWLGIVDHVTDSGFPADRLILCHRGFSVFGRDNPDNLRNLPDYEMAMRVREITGLPMIIDPSHIGGNTENVLAVLRNAQQYDFDGVMIEAHPDPKVAMTDAKQQLTFSVLNNLL